MTRLLFVAAMVIVGCQKPAAAPAAPAVEQRAAFKPIGAVEGENPGYDAVIDPARVIAALELKPGMHIADIGAGRGYFELRLSKAVGSEGVVVATDVDEDAIATLQNRLSDLPNVKIRKVEPDEPGLEDGAYDLILMSQVDHFLSDRVSFLRKLTRALKPGGRLAVTHTHALKPPLAAAAREAGLVVVGSETFKSYYLLVFQPG